MIDNRVLPCLYQLLSNNHKKSIKKEACWTISNITAGNRSQIQVIWIPLYMSSNGSCLSPYITWNIVMALSLYILACMPDIGLPYWIRFVRKVFFFFFPSKSTSSFYSWPTVHFFSSLSLVFVGKWLVCFLRSNFLEDIADCLVCLISCWNCFILIFTVMIWTF